jgi:hypothetical protein
MKSIAGSIVVLAGSFIMGLAAKEIPNEALPTITSLGLMVIGLTIVFTSDRATNK